VTVKEEENTMTEEAEAKLRVSAELHARVDAAVAQLDQREQRVLRRRFLNCNGAVTLGDLGRELGIAPEDVRQIEGGALEKLRASLADFAPCAAAAGATP